MILNHINITVANVNAASEFFIRYFDFTSTDAKPNDTMSVLKGGDGFILVVMNNKLNEKGNNIYPDAFHLGFFTLFKEEVIAKYDLLKAGGIALPQQPQNIRRAFGFYFHLENIMIEVAAQINESI